MPVFEVGQRVRIKETAFPGSDDPVDIAARGREGVLISFQGEDLWYWGSDDGRIKTAPIESELEALDEKAE